jgi:hypothetical protein
MARTEGENMDNTRTYDKELERSLRAGLSEKTATACAEYAVRERMARGSSKAPYIPRWRNPLNAR